MSFLPKIGKKRVFPVLTGSVWAGLKRMIIFEISGFDYVGWDTKSIDYGPLRAKNR